MIIDKLENLENYVALNPLFAEVVNFLKNNKWDDVEDGKHLIKGNDVFVNVMHLKGKTQEEAAMEYHRKMIDIQVPISDDEVFGYIPQADLPAMEYVEEKDMAKLGGVASQTYVKVKKGQFVIFFPQDGHAPGIYDKGELRKAIFKVKA
ncbi:MAG: YhcH/YjgK/YiaL family protein [Prevotella sp.]|nr:YhcH/YjgK/YiaL family protein [Prevotella sp.]